VGRRICVGPGPFPILGWENYDLNPSSEKDCANAAHIIKRDAFEVDYAGAEYVFAGHFIEHLDPVDAHRFIRMVREKAPEAVLILVVPVLDRSNDPSVDFALLQQIISHHTTYPDAPRGIAHRSWWRTRDLLSALQAAGYSKVTEWPDCPWLVAQVNWQIVLKAAV
jgi:hypothetical protein